MDTKSAVEYVENLQKNITLIKKSLIFIILSSIIIVFFLFPSIFYFNTIENIIVEHLDDEIAPYGRVKNADWHLREYLKDYPFIGIFFWIGLISYFALGISGLYFLHEFIYKKGEQAIIHIEVIGIIIIVLSEAYHHFLSMSYF